jgi:hypothetical protein
LILKPRMRPAPGSEVNRNSDGTAAAIGVGVGVAVGVTEGVGVGLIPGVGVGDGLLPTILRGEMVQAARKASSKSSRQQPGQPCVSEPKRNSIREGDAVSTRAVGLN